MRLAQRITIAACVVIVGSLGNLLSAQQPAQVIDSIIPGLAPVVLPDTTDLNGRTRTRWIADDVMDEVMDAAEKAHSAQQDAAADGADSEVISRGRDAFDTACTTCHDAERSLKKRKTLANWLTTVRRMAKMDDAEVEDDDIEPIATYLASLGPPSKADEADDKSDKDDAEDKDADKKDDAKSSASPEVIARGQQAFQTSCTTCHDADRSLQKKKSKSGWLSTVRRMARMDDADVKESDIDPIATYLASLNDSGGSGDGGDDGDGGGGGLGSDLSVSGTFSTLFRGGNDNLETPGFFPDIWLTADWQPAGPLRGRVTLCTTCHSDQTDGGGFTLEFVEGVASLDLLHWYKERDRRPEHCKLGVVAEVKAGRFVVPFGAFAGISHPGSYRTVSNPLMYAMGRQVAPNRNRPPLLPMPYSDEGVDLTVKVPLTGKVDATLDVYVVNGLQASGAGVSYTRSRAYVDNNLEPAIGGRATVGNSTLRFGGSVMSGEMQDDGAPVKRFYNFAGGDVTGRFFDNLIRTYFEYAIRKNDSPFPNDQMVYGTVTEIEALLLGEPNLSLLGRYDTMEFRDNFGKDSIARFTWGLSTTSIGGSLLMFNHERWYFPTPDNDVDVVGVRWVTAF
ncbi:MAG: hypothetical protein KDA92_06275 [Planctomycetales bacterium]|nr:hypothetical protein [Planctomycetales bacterium]